MRNKQITKILSAVTAAGFAVIFSIVGIHLLSTSHAVTPLCPPEPAPLAVCRPLLGAATYGNPGTPSNPLPANEVNNDSFQFSYLEGLVGTGFKFNVFRDYHCVYGGAACTGAMSSVTSTEQHYAAMGDSININWLPSPSWTSYPVSSGSSGSAKVLYDEIVQAANSLKSLAPTPVYLTLWHEMNLHVTSSGVSGCQANGTGGIGTPAQFITAWQNIHDIFKAQGVTNVYWTMNYAGGSHACLAPLMYPGDAYVDWVTWDTYSRGKPWDQESGVFYNDLLSENGQKNAQGQPADFTAKPWGIGEFGTCRQPSGGESEPAYFTSIQQAYQANTYPRLHMYEIYANNAEGNGSGCLTDYDTDPANPGGNGGPYDAAKQRAVNSLLTTIAGGSQSPTPSVSLTAPQPGSAVSGTTTVSANASVAGGSITSVVLKANGATLKTCTSTGACSSPWDTTVLANGSYTLEADTVASDGNTNTATESVVVSNSHPVTISPPSNVTSPSQTTSGIALAWKAAADSKYPAAQLTYQVFRNGSKVGSTAAGVTSFTDSGLSAGTYYSYTLTAHDPAGNISSSSAAYTQKTQAPNCVRPSAPQSFVGHATDATTVNLSWKSVSNPSSSCVINHYVISRNTIPLSQPNGVSFADTTAIPNTTYTYTVLAVETGNIAGPAASVTVTTPQSTQPDPGPSAPGNVSATAVSDTQVNLTWNASTDPVTGIKQYNVLRNGTQVGTSATTSFGDSGLASQTQYTYQIIAVSGGGKMTTSSSVNATTLPSRAQSGSSSGEDSSGSGGNTPAAVPPVLQGTTSVGSGSDTGQSSSDNPTDPGSSTTSQLDQSGTTTKTQSVGDRKVAYVGGGTIIVLMIAGAGYWLHMLRRRSVFRPSIEFSDPDFKSSAVVGDDKRGPDGKIG